ncbi:MAG: D-glycero-beta-D-manno-heptose-7-phosphate kinase [Dictyoglomus sp. NZ13-RE01]|nr:MAG: D-glycero-beta-D-manno-heptose-7-phosphate kinase [Dictyoglomus sp. NZ13-RE01]
MNKSRFLDIIGHWHGKRIGVIGDIMLDEYIMGKVTRISPEAPVPIVEMEQEFSVLGGAGNVANNIKSLGGEVILFGVIGNDEGGKKILNLLRERKIMEELIIDENRPTTTKTRIIALNQQVVRVDREKKESISQEIEEKIINSLENKIKNLDGIVISDYLKGVLTFNLTQKIIRLAKKEGKFIIVDPKGRDYSKYLGATLITPNEKEAQIATNSDENFNIKEIAEKLFDIVKGDGVLITRGEKGMFLYQAESQVFIPALASQVRDVTGAGDTVVATLALALSGGANLLEASILSNLSASITVRKLGTAVVTPEELKQILPEKLELKDGWIFFK